MMAYKSGFFNSMNGDRKYNAEDMSNFYGQLISNGVLSKAEGSLKVSAGTGLTVTIAKGWAWINCHWFYNDSIITLDIPTVGAEEKTFSVALRLYDDEQLDGRKIVPEVIEGTTPVRDTFTYDLILAHVYVPSNSVNISNSNITDTRADTNLCGWVTGLITQVDTTTLFKQWQSAYMEFYIEFTSWFNDLTETLGIATFNNRIEINAISSKNQMNFKPNVADYDTSDILDVYINNFRLTPNIDYTFSGNGSNLNISFKNALDSDNNISVVILQSKKGVATSNFQSIDTVAPSSNVNSISAIFSTYERID